ncbi:membrane protein [Sulfurifustis variabilis]|uniref:Membrane protein n=2 Tax=Sulfurifustis variabilis TaxID=1675686 RepID=A0A1B4V5P4_9GAMM|nr:DUF423 domain-containing protein [Sulfurifustis variabilis]BAU48755.1 membrane protein [Sulfurifustis variabilis]
MPFPAKLFLALGSVSAMLVVVLGAFGAHALRARIPAELMASYQTGILYHLFHALGLLAVGLIAAHLPASGLVRAAGWLMLVGTVLFSGSLYVLAISGVRALGAVTPFGGFAFIAAWLLLAVALFRS